MKPNVLLATLIALSIVPKDGFAQSLDSAMAKSKFQFLSMKGGAGIDGGGGDGLEMESIQTQRRGETVVVPVPDALVSKYGYVRIDGQPGAQQEGKGSYRFCQTNAKGEIVYFGCTYPKDIELNKSTRLPVGVYRIYYSNSVQYVKVTEGTTSVLPLIKIQVPKIQGTVHYNVFRDFTSPKMQDQLAKDYYSMKQTVDTREMCGTYVKDLQKVPELKALCRAVQSEGYKEFLNVLQFFPDATFSTVYGHDGGYKPLYLPRERYYIVDPKDGDFVSVLPGIYGIEFKNPETGATQSQYGIVVE